MFYALAAVGGFIVGLLLGKYMTMFWLAQKEEGDGRNYEKHKDD